MEDITHNEIGFVLRIFKTPEKEYNARIIAKDLGISAMGALKIARRLEKEQILSSKELGKARFYKLNLDREYVQQYVRFLLRREAEQSLPYIKRWIKEIEQLKHVDLAILFGSVLRKQKQAKDIDVVLVTDNKRYRKLKKEVEERNKINIKRLHPIYQTKNDLKENIKSRHKPVLNAIKGIVVFGEETLVKIIRG